MPEIVGIFGSKGDALTAVDELYQLGYGDTEIGFLDRTMDEVERKATTGSGVTHAIARAAVEDEIGWIYRESVKSGSAVLTVSTIEGDETDVRKAMYATGALKVNSYRDETGWME